MPFTVRRKKGGRGSAESENGWACHHIPLVRKRHSKNCPPATARRSRCLPRQMTETVPGPSGWISTTSRRCRSVRNKGSPNR